MNRPLVTNRDDATARHDEDPPDGDRTIDGLAADWNAIMKLSRTCFTTNPSCPLSTDVIRS